MPGFISDHSYMQAPGDESDSFLLDDTVSDSGSVLDWTTRYADYQTVLAANAGQPGVERAGHGHRIQFGLLPTPASRSTSLVNGLFVAESLGSLYGQRLQRRLRLGPAKRL